VPVLGYSEQPVPYLVMKFAPNGMFKDRYPLGQRYSLAAILPHVRQIAEGLQHAHNQQTLHLDLKPANVLLGKTHEAVISDFGIALILAEHKTHKTVGDFAGTPIYAAPEQFAKKPSKASDQYALATMVYQWLAGKFPFEGDLVAIIGQKLSQGAGPLRSHVPNLPPAAEQAVLRALAKDPQARFPSVLDFARALESAARLPAPAPAPIPTPASPQKTKEQ
jgi:serine/threonine protein kinase